MTLPAPFEGTAKFEKLWTDTTIEWNPADSNVSLVGDAPNGTIVISIEEHRCTLTQNAEAVEFDGRRADLSGGAKRAVFTKDGGLEVSDQE